MTFTQPPTDVGEAIMAVFDDTCGNLIQIIAEKQTASSTDPVTDRLDPTTIETTTG